MRPIDAEAFEESIEQIEWYHLAGNGEMVQGATSGNGWYKEQDIYNAIEKAPTVEAKPVVHAHWIEQEYGDCDTYYTCSNCEEDLVTIDGTPSENLWNYCPYCGAQMDEVTLNE